MTYQEKMNIAQTIIWTLVIAGIFFLFYSYQNPSSVTAPSKPMKEQCMDACLAQGDNKTNCENTCGGIMKCINRYGANQ